MKIEQMYTACLAEAAYYIESEGEAIVIDPLRDPQPYIDRAKASNATIKYVLETHFHADFVSGHIDLAKAVGAKIVYGPGANPGFDAYIATDGEEIQIGNVVLKVLHTPGHTMESTTYLLYDEAGKEHAIFTGDTLFIGDVGRPDLAVKSDLTQEDLAGLLFGSLRNKIMPLPDDVIVYPAHGKGSACGKNMSSETYDTLGHQKKVNYALRETMTKATFVAEVIDGLTKPPQYFPKNALMNQNGYDGFTQVMTRGNQPLSIEQFEEEIEKGALVIDTRHQSVFVKGFIPHSIFIGIDGNFAVWVGTLISNINQPILIVADEGRQEEVIMRLSRVGYDHCIGYLDGGFEAWQSAGKPVHSIDEMHAEQFAEQFHQQSSMSLLDVRKIGEYESSHVDGSTHFPLDAMQENLHRLKDKNEAYYIHCAGGYRSVIAASIMKAKGFESLINIPGGYAAIKATDLKRTEVACSS